MGKEDVAAKKLREEQVMKVYKMLDPRPKELLLSPRKYITGGVIQTYNVKERRRKPRVLFLFNDMLLVGKREGRCKYWLKTLVRLNKLSMKLEDMRTAKPPVEFRLITPKRVLIFFTQTEGLKKAWIKHIQAALDGKYELDYEAPASSSPASGSPSPSPAPSAAPPSAAAANDATAPTSSTSSSETSKENTRGSFTMPLYDPSKVNHSATNASNASFDDLGESLGVTHETEVLGGSSDQLGDSIDIDTDTPGVIVIEKETTVFSFGAAVEDTGNDSDLAIDISNILSDLDSLSLSGYPLEEGKA